MFQNILNNFGTKLPLPPIAASKDSFDKERVFAEATSYRKCFVKKLFAIKVVKIHQKV